MKIFKTCSLRSKYRIWESNTFSCQSIKHHSTCKKNCKSGVAFSQLVFTDLGLYYLLIKQFYK